MRMEDELVQPWGEDGPVLTFIQGLAFVKLDLEIEVEAIEMCDNHCCLMISEEGLDETCWRISPEGVTEKIDHYGNTIERTL